MIRHTMPLAVLGLMIFALPCSISADSTPKKSTPTKPVPQIVQPSTPSKLTRQHTPRQPYHPHTAKGGGAQTKHSTSGPSGH
jgi:hypothetical protein